MPLMTHRTCTSKIFFAGREGNLHSELQVGNNGGNSVQSPETFVAPFELPRRGDEAPLDLAVHESEEHHSYEHGWCHNGDDGHRGYDRNCNARHKLLSKVLRNHLYSEALA